MPSFIVGTLFALVLYVTGHLSYLWSFGETTFGGWAGFILPLFLVCFAFILGTCVRGKQ